MISFNEALHKIKKENQCLSKTADTPLHLCLNRYTAEDIIAPISMPPLPNSAMDGYAIHASDWQNNKPFPTHILCAAGDPLKKIGKNQAARIYTGAIIPEGANAVIPQEQTSEIEGGIVFNEPVAPNQFIRFVGEDFKKGDKLLSKGERIQHTEILLLANAGIGTVQTYQPLRVAVLATGDELLPLNTPWQAGKIFDSNRPCIQAILTEWGVDVNFTKTINDDLNSTKTTLLEAAQCSDVIITTGGVSVGDKDYIKLALQEVGELNTWKVNIKPGKPIALGKVSTTPFIGLPGNPVSALSTLLLLGRPLIKKAQGAHPKYIDIMPWKVPANFTYQTAGRQDFLRARLVLPSDAELNKAWVDIFERQQSHIVSSFQWADGLISIPRETTIQSGDLVEYYPFHQFMH